MGFINQIVGEKEEIIVYRKFDNSIDANIAKTKLDAYGVPCFLTEENMSNLYPGQPFFAFKVRLHIFKQDEERANQVLSDIRLTTDADDNHLSCPKCKSGRITRAFPKELSDNLTFIFFGVLFPHKKVNHCLQCNNEF